MFNSYPVFKDQATVRFVFLNSAYLYYQTKILKSIGKLKKVEKSEEK